MTAGDSVQTTDLISVALSKYSVPDDSRLGKEPDPFDPANY